MIVKMIQPSLIFEIGTFTGYATLAMAEAMPENCRIKTIEKNRENAALAHDFFVKGGYEEKIELLIGDAMKIIENLEFGSELVFIDADKRNNKQYYELILPKVKTGGFLLIDNVLWDGKVLDVEQDKDTEAIIDFNAHVQNDSRVENVLLPFRDGILLVRKK
jgi:predicted O-methyltransferase YrrM